MSTLIHCRCGAVEVEISAAPLMQFYCHCDDCQAAHGAAYVPESVYPAEAVKVLRGLVTGWMVRKTPRVTCAVCGTRLFADVVVMGVRGVNGSLLPAGSFRPTFHMQCKFAVLPVRDQLPHYRSMPGDLGGSDDLVGW